MITDMTPEEVTAIKKQLKDVDDKLNNILSLLQGHPLDEEKSGLIHKIKDQEARIIRLETFNQRIMWVCLGFSIPAAWGTIDVIRLLMSAIK